MSTDRRDDEVLAVLKLAQKWLANCVPVADLDGPKPLPKIARLIAKLQSGDPGVAVAPRCSQCGGPHLFDTTVPSAAWNAVVRAAGLPDYLCATCILRAFLDAGKSFTCEIDGVPLEVRIDSQDAWDATLISEENTRLRARIRELEMQSRPGVAVAPPHELIKRLRQRAEIERPPDASEETRAAYDDVPAISFDELREIADLLTEAADALAVRAVAPPQENKR